MEMGKELHYLSAKEASETWSMNQYSLRRPWALWTREVECNPLYVNESKKAVAKNS